LPKLNNIICFSLIENHRGQKGRHMTAFQTKTPNTFLNRTKKRDVAGLRQAGDISADAKLHPSGFDLPASGDPAADPVEKYLDEISVISLLSAGDEKALAKRIRKGIMARKKLEQNDVRGREKERLTKQADRGRLAEGLLFKANLRLVAYLAGGYSNCGMSLSDLIQEGNLGLMRAVEKFDHRKGTRFSTYAAYWIKQAINRAISRQASTVRLPEHTIQTLNDINGIRLWLEAEQGREAGCEEIALEMGLLSAEDVKKIKKARADGKPLDAALKKRWSEAAGRVGALAGIGRESIPFGGSGDEEEGRSPEELLGDKANPDPFQIVFRQEINARLCEIIGSLNELECRVLQMRFGLVDGFEMTVDEVAEELGLAPQRVRQLEARAMRNLRHPDLSSRLKELLK
jgi:RNA polymerase primary sigma factor